VALALPEGGSCRRGRVRGLRWRARCWRITIRTRTGRDRKDQSVDDFTLAPAVRGERRRLLKGFAEGVIVAESQNFARQLVNEPGNKLTPTILGSARRRWRRGMG
jgi:leucyl aminopeptidase